MICSFVNLIHFLFIFSYLPTVNMNMAVKRNVHQRHWELFESKSPPVVFLLQVWLKSSWLLLMCLGNELQLCWLISFTNKADRPSFFTLIQSKHIKLSKFLVPVLRKLFYLPAFILYIFTLNKRLYVTERNLFTISIFLRLINIMAEYVFSTYIHLRPLGYSFNVSA